MQIDAQRRHASLSAGEFANFSTYPPPPGSLARGVWRAQLGQQWHSDVQSQATEDGFENEIPIEATLRWRNWSLRLNGRIDQARFAPDRVTLREIKTTSLTLPLSDEDVPARIPHHVVQLLAYREMLLRSRHELPERIELELLLIEIQSGLNQAITLGPSHETLLTQKLDLLCDFLESKRDRLQRLSQLAHTTAYPTPRPGQETIQADLASAFSKSNITLLEAPTGYGKTGVAWEFALNQLGRGPIERLVYLTGKSTGQIEAVNRLRAMLGDDSGATYWQIRNKREHCINHEFRCSPATCRFLHDLETKWQTSGLQRLYLMAGHEISLEEVKAESGQAGICPYETMRAALGFRDIWIGDYNYLFAPRSMHLLGEQADFNPARTFLIIDEAHNLPSRVESSLSHAFTLSQAEAALEDAHFHLPKTRLRRQLQLLADELAHIDRCDELDPPQTDAIIDLLLSLAQTLQQEVIDYDLLLAETADLLWTIPFVTKLWQESSETFLLWAPQRGHLQIDCLDASQHIAATLAPFHQALFLSATLSPIPAFCQRCGIDHQLPPPVHLAPPASWLEGAYDLAIDTRVDTRYRSRDRYLDTTATAIARVADSQGPTVAFFPSYAYAEKALRAFDRLFPQLRVATQPSGLSLAEQEEFVDQSLLLSDVLFLVLGSSFAEGIDCLGGRVKAAIVVSPALPEVNAFQKRRSELAERRGEKGFEVAYLQPGMQRINQALGRLVRAPGQSVKVLLHCQRFAQRQTRALLSPQYANPTYLHEDPDLEAWLASPPSSSP